MIQFSTRWMILKDLPEVLEIERDCFDLPWSEQDFRCFLGEMSSIGFVIEAKDQVIGYFVYELLPGAIHLVNIAVCPVWQQSGAGSYVMRKLKSKLHQQRRESISCEVSDSNLDAHLFLRSCGFRATHVERDAFEGVAGDSYHFEYRLDFETAKPVNRVDSFLRDQSERA